MGISMVGPSRNTGIGSGEDQSQLVVLTWHVQQVQQSATHASRKGGNLRSMVSCISQQPQLPGGISAESFLGLSPLSYPLMKFPLTAAQTLPCNLRQPVLAESPRRWTGRAVQRHAYSRRCVHRFSVAEGQRADEAASSNAGRKQPVLLQCMRDLPTPSGKCLPAEDMVVYLPSE